MCGRYVSPSEAEIERFWHIGRHNSNPFGPRYNVSPTTVVPMLRSSDTGGLDLVMARWGLIPFWWKEAKPPRITFNARSEEAASKPMWRVPASKSRCLVSALGWYEWKEIERVDPATGEVTKAKQPHFIRLPDGQPFAFAGLMSRRTAEGDTSEFTCSILTQEAVGPAVEVHSRMPVVLPKYAEAAWLDAALTDATKAIELARLHAVTALEHYPVSARVNNAKNEDAELIERVIS
jgi:putative SOS response-associated peptidase YedK